MGRTTIRYCNAATTTTTMKFIVSILCLGVASASPQGFGGLGISGQQNFQQNFNIQQGFCGEPGFGGMQGAGCRAGQERQGCPAPNINRWATVCPGPLQKTCFGRGLDNPCAFYIFPQTVQCMARAAQQASTGGDSFRVRVDFDGHAFITDTFGTPVEDIEIFETGFTLAAQQQAQAKQLKLESLVNFSENFCGLQKRR